MIDLNKLIPAGSQLQLIYALSINDRGEIAGNGLLPNGDTRAFLLIPCGENHGDGECEDEAKGTARARGEANQRPNVVLPENVRQFPKKVINPSHIPGVYSRWEWLVGTLEQLVKLRINNVLTVVVDAPPQSGPVFSG